MLTTKYLMGFFSAKRKCNNFHVSIARVQTLCRCLASNVGKVISVKVCMAVEFSTLNKNVFHKHLRISLDQLKATDTMNGVKVVMNFGI